jgi:flavin reductase (DIM6/NTAB) family NADH-FMN oxidoreductase RutF
MTVDARELRTCLGQFATGVTIVSCGTGEAVRGATVNAFMAVSLDPPLVAVSLDRRSKLCRHLRAQPFAVTVLGSEAHDTALHFAGLPQPDVGIEWDHGPTTPAVSGGIATFICTPWATYDGGDHLLYVGQVQEITRRLNGSPLLFFGGTFRDIGPHIPGAPWLETLDSPMSGVDWLPKRSVLPQLTKEAR